LTLIDLEKGAPAGTIDLPEGARPHGSYPLSDGRLLVTAEGLKELLVIDPKERRIESRIPTGREVSHMVVATPDAKRAFVANIGSGSGTAIDPAGKKVLRDIPTGDGAEGNAITPDQRKVWATNSRPATVSV